MKTSALALGLLAAVAHADPTPTEEQPPSKRSDVPSVTASGNAFWLGSDRFYIRGVDYQPGGSSAMTDPLADETGCKRDIAEFTKLGVNTVRVYMVDNSVNHDTCMNALAAANIYLILDVNNPLYSINRASPKASYNDVYLQSVFATIDAFVNYPNTLAFFSGNEVVNDEANTTLAAPYVKATTRDMRQYIKERGYRAVPVGYSAADVSQNRYQLAEYFNCGTDDERSDFFAFNDYSWCNTDFVTSGWDQKVQNFTGYGLPLFLSEYGCTTNGRSFGEVAALMSTNMTGVYSGGIVYEYSEESDNAGYGLVSISGSTVSQMSDFTAYSTALSKNPEPTGDGGFTSTTNTQACPTVDSNWLVSDTLLPAIPSAAEKYMTEGAGKGPGLTGDGSQNAGGTSTGDASPGSGSATTTATPSSTGKKNVGSRPAPLDKYGFLVTGVVFFATLAGTMLL
ncbi:family 72 glycoside hydrolase [Cryphonectria parasitica EP155]|uniref:1,3-beta-glucanosyltransferase n=1 Tax=Cryphonectria parasitica (strain ATCC 38755 / EP155) TaxID=660469 RepID=A0A9P4XT93_CRYP1|nr:family 72 glycoside hydrolase [Cryphonectria parasitica EP155]KAF3760498.1 family 72 glycoside hydrolase [Cryphonectria parasitica EP155]